MSINKPDAKDGASFLAHMAKAEQNVSAVHTFACRGACPSPSVLWARQNIAEVLCWSGMSDNKEAVLITKIRLYIILVAIRSKSKLSGTSVWRTYLPNDIVGLCGKADKAKNYVRCYLFPCHTAYCCVLTELELFCYNTCILLFL